MERITITIDDDLLQAVDGLMARRGYTSRSEAVRDILRDALGRQQAGDPQVLCVAALSYVYDHTTRGLAGRVTHTHHAHHDISVASLHVHLDHDSCLEVSVLRGATGSVTAFADALATQRGVRHAYLHVVPASVSTKRHAHGDGGAEHTHVHA
jgi:CopG family transcriptional regulator, nickel-responsive regulator